MIDNTIRKEVYDGDGSTVEWTIPFDYSDTEQVKLYTVTDDVETEITTNFSINNNVITYPVDGVPVPEGTKVLVIRKTPLKQLESSVETPFTSADVERALDKLTCEVQEVKEDVDRALKSPEWSKESADVLLKQVQQEVATFESQLSAETSNRISADAMLLSQTNSKMPLTGGTFTGDVTLNSGVSLKTQNGRIHEVNNKIVIGEKSSDKGFYVSPNGETAALVGNTVKNILTNNDVTSTYSPSGVSPVNGQAVASALSGISGQLPDQTGKEGKFLSTDGTDASWEDIPTFTQEQADWSEADNTKASFIKNKPTIPDVSGKANLAGGNSFTGTQSIANASNTVGIQLFETTNNSHSDITQTSLGLNVVCNSTNAGFKFNDVSLLKNMVNISSFPATLVENKNYYATVSGSATFVLPTPTNTSFENSINILLTVSVNSTVDWGVNANSVLSSFTAGKYEIRLRYNNATSNWIGEVLKAKDVPNPVKLYVPFNNTAEDLSNNPVSLSAISPDTTFPTYGDGKFAGTKAILTKQYKGFTVGGDKTKLNLGSGDFTLSFWIKSTANSYNDYNYILYSNGSTFITPKQIYYNSNLIFSDTNVSYDGEFHYVCYARHNNSLYRFVDGTRTKKVTYSGNIDFSDIARIATITSSWGTNQDAYVQELLLTNTCDYDDDTTTISVPTAPYVLADNSLADLHDNTKQNSLNTSQMNAVNSGITSTTVGQIATNTSSINTINGKIPSQATSLNQLADKNFVNSSIATNTANFIGTFNSVAALEAYSGTLTNNDYAFVIDTDAAGNTLYKRYKYSTASTPAAWVYEYTLNNSSFTAAQWAAINSGITSTQVPLIATALQSVPYATSSTVGGIKVEFDSVNGVLNIITED